MSPSIAEAYRAGQLPDFFRLTPADLAEHARTWTSTVDRTALAAALRGYHTRLGTLDRVTERQLERLAHPASRVVVTGQQAGLLTGPAYSVHKGADAALLARQLDREDAPVVPIYWVASQDHDVDEVAGVTLLDMHETPLHLRLDLPRGRMVGRVAWQDGWTRQIEATLDRFEAPPEHVERVRSLVRRAVAGGGSYADVFARLVHGLLGAAGLVVLDPLDPDVARLFAPALTRELDDPTRSSQLVEDAAVRLERLGFEPQLRRPEGATNLFLEGGDGQRRLLRWDGRHLHADRAYTPEDLREIIADDPTRVTPAAGLRPVVQDSVLPTVAFVVGPGEIAYGAQLGEVYELHGLAQPLLWPRLSVTWLEPPVARLLTRFGLSAGEFQRDPDGALGRALLRERGAAARVATRLDALRDTFGALASELRDLDPTLVGAAQRTEQRTLARLERLQEQTHRALVGAEDTRSGQATRLRRHLLPRGVAQERELSFLSLMLKHGDAPQRQLLSLPPGFTGEVTVG